VIEPSLAATLGLPADLMVVAGTTDSNAATLAAGDHESGDAVTSLGSTLVVKVWSERPVNAAQFGVYSHRLNDRWLAGGASNSGGAVLRQHFSDAELADLSATLDPHRSTGLDYYPLPATGERFPVNDPDLQPRLAPVPADRAVFLQGMLEGIARIEADGYRRLAELGAPFPSRVFTAGGGAANPAWSAIRQRLLGVPVMTATHGEAAYGVASLARAAWQSA
jgi:sugar (pentulose or hexulose) kinase